jgi:hypothetical protein
MVGGLWGWDVVGGPDLSPLWALLSLSFPRYPVPLELVKVGSGGDPGLGAVRTCGGEGAPPTAYEPSGSSLDPYKHKSHKYLQLQNN